MSKLRSVNTGFWSDPFIEDLNPSEKLLFLYLITNEKTNMLGIYEASLKKISFETGINKETVLKALKGFERIGKVKYVNNYIILVNYMKHQKYNTNMKKSAIKAFNELPKELNNNNLVLDASNPSEAFETLLNHFGMVRKIEVKVEDKIEVKTKIEKAKDFYNFELNNNQDKKYIKYYKKLIDVLFGDNINKDPLNRVLSMKNQITYEQFEGIMEIKNNVSLTNIIETMNSKKKYCEYDNLAITIRNWVKRQNNE